MGCGTGIVSIFCASIGAHCTAADINPEAVKAAKENAEINGFGKEIGIIQSDLFENIKDRFDLIFFNPPFYPKEPADNFEKAFNAGKEYRIIKEFAERSSGYLKKDGIIYLIISSDVDMDKIKSIFSENALTFEVALKLKKFFETFYIIKSYKKEIL